MFKKNKKEEGPTPGKKLEVRQGGVALNPPPPSFFTGTALSTIPCALLTVAVGAIAAPPKYVSFSYRYNKKVLFFRLLANIH